MPSPAPPGTSRAGTGGQVRGSAAVGYGTFITGPVTATVLSLSTTVRELRATREQPARSAVAKELLRSPTTRTTSSGTPPPSSS
ncbi:hypothetical protein GCM10010446_11760 [Streptomyces enissocaesilis]|uniref:Uncharacterized protein n=1 Tax=Streptomyces enissocaesilis TaxID=332589 RepID=A0ABP6JF47_9ACTN